MNAERILKLADVIERAPHKAFDSFAEDRPLDGFNMARVHCGTVGCIKGWAEHLFKKDGGEALGIDHSQSELLFYPEVKGRYEEITPAQAATVLRHLAATSEVDWSVAS